VDHIVTAAPVSEHTLRPAFRDAGRDPASLDVCAGLRDIDGSLARSMDGIPELAEAGNRAARPPLQRRQLRIAGSPDAAAR